MGRYTLFQAPGNVQYGPQHTNPFIFPPLVHQFGHRDVQSMLRYVYVAKRTYENDIGI